MLKNISNKKWFNYSHFSTKYTANCEAPYLFILNLRCGKFRFGLSKSFIWQKFIKKNSSEWWVLNQARQWCQNWQESILGSSSGKKKRKKCEKAFPYFPHCLLCPFFQTCGQWQVWHSCYLVKGYAPRNSLYFWSFIPSIHWQPYCVCSV